MGEAALIGLILAAAGAGSRFGGDIPKQFSSMSGKPLYLHALEPFVEFFDEAVMVVPEAWKDRVEEQIQLLPYRGKLLLQTGGPERQDSVYRGLSWLSDSIQIVLVHDAARPFVSQGLIARVVEQTRQGGACVPALPPRDTVKEVDFLKVLRTLDRRRLRLAQTPQGFEINLLRRALEQAQKEDFYGTDEASLVERLGAPVYVVAGEPENIKVTWKEDL